MSRADGVLSVVLKRQPFLDIDSGVKREEYRGFNWADRLLTAEGMLVAGSFGVGQLDPRTAVHDAHFHRYHTLRAYLGYRKGRPMLERRILGIKWGTPNPAWTYGIISPGDCFVIDLGERIA